MIWKWGLLQKRDPGFAQQCARASTMCMRYYYNKWLRVACLLQKNCWTARAASCDGLSSPSSRFFRWVYNSQWDKMSGIARRPERIRSELGGWGEQLRDVRRSGYFLREVTCPTSKYLYGERMHFYIFQRRRTIVFFLQKTWSAQKWKIN